MKKLSLLLMCFTIAVTASAVVKSQGNAYRPMDKAAKVAKMNAPSRVDIITEQPEGTVVNYLRGGEYLLSSLYGYETSMQSGRVKVVYADDGTTVYIQDILCYGEGSGVWVVGELSEDGLNIIVPLGQYIAYNETYGYGVVLAWGSTEVIDLGDDFYWLDFVADERAEEVVYSIDPENGTITMENSEGSVDNPYPYNCVATGLAGLWSDDGSVATIEWKSTWTKLAEVAVPAVPVNPEALEFFDCGDESGFTRFDFNINLFDVDGNPLNPDYLTYSIFTDDNQLFTFDYETYGPSNGFETDMTEIPYGFSGYDFYLRRVYFYRTNEGDNPLFNQNIGIQVYYTVDGVRNASDIVWLYDVPEPEDPHMTGYWLVMVQADGTEEYVELNQAQNGDYVTIYDVIYPMYYNVGNFYFLINGVAYGAAEDCTDAVLGNSMLNPLTADTNNTYQVGNGYSYVLGIHFVIDETTGEIAGYTAYVAVGGPVSVDELNAGKTVANVRYFNVAGQEMAQPSGMTIQVTTYTDGTTSAAKVMK